MAGVLEDKLLSEQTAESLKNVFLPKAQAAWYLHHYTKQHNISLDYFVLFSSIASSMGSPGQSNYAAANSFLDQLAHYRHQQGLAATSINWGPWANAGMAHNLIQEHQRKGFFALNDKEGARALLYALEQSEPVIQAAHIDWARISQHTSQVPSWLESLVHPKASQGSLINLLEQAPKEQREALLKAELARLIKDTLGLSSHHVINDTQGFFEMGMDSLMAVELKNRLQASLGNTYPISNTLIFEQPNLNALTEHLANNILHEVFERALRIGNTDLFAATHRRAYCYHWHGMSISWWRG